jgi:hypothetical protein
MNYVELVNWLTPIISLLVLLVKLLPSFELIVKTRMSRRLTKNGTVVVSYQVNVTLRKVTSH